MTATPPPTITQRTLHSVQFRQETVAVNLAVTNWVPLKLSDTMTLHRCYTLNLTFISTNGLPWQEKWSMVGWINMKNQRDTTIKRDHFRDGIKPPAWIEEQFAKYRKELPPR